MIIETMMPSIDVTYVHVTPSRIPLLPCLYIDSVILGPNTQKIISLRKIILPYILGY